MSADLYLDCPRCLTEGSVRIDGSHDIEIYEDGELCVEISGYCSNCKQEYRIKDKK
jgi:hypothetical protein